MESVKDRRQSTSTLFGSLSNMVTESIQVRRRSRRQSAADARQTALEEQQQQADAALANQRSLLTLKAIIREKQVLEALYEYCLSQHCVENLMFWIIVETFRKVHDPELVAQLGLGVNEDLLRAQAKSIFDQYLKNDAENWVCVDCKDVEVIQLTLEKNGIIPCANPRPAVSSSSLAAPLPPVGSTLFNAAQNRTRKDLEEDILPRFVRTLLAPGQDKYPKSTVAALQDLLSNASQVPGGKPLKRSKSIAFLRSNRF